MSELNVDQINPRSPGLPVNFTGPSIPTYNGVPINATGGDAAGILAGQLAATEGVTMVGNAVDKRELASSAVGKGSKLVAFIQRLTGAVARWTEDKLAEHVSVFDFMTSAQIADVKAGALTLDVTAAFQAALNSFPATGGVLEAPQGSYLLDGSQIVIPPNVGIVGQGRMSTIFKSTVSRTLFSVSGSSAENFNFFLQDLQIFAKNGLVINPGAFNGSAPLVMPRFIRVFFLGTYTSASGDPLFQTDSIKNTGGSTIPCLSGVNPSPNLTYTDVSSYGIGVYAQCMFDALFEQCQFVHLGVGASLNGSDINKFDDCRFHQNGWHYYESRVGTFGSQNKLVDCDILQNYRAGGVVLNGTKFSRVTGNYFEDNGPWGCYFWLDGTEGIRVSENRFDDSNYYSTLPAFAIVNNPSFNNVIEGNDYNLYSFSESPEAKIRNIGYSNQDSNHFELLRVSNNSLWFPKLKDYLPGYNSKPVDRFLYDPMNAPRTLLGNISPLSVFDAVGGANGYSIYNASAASVSARFDLEDAVRNLYDLTVSARTVSGTNVFFTITHNDINGNLKATLVSANTGGFISSGYVPVNIPLTLSSNLLAQGDCIIVTWVSNSAYVRGLRLK